MDSKKGHLKMFSAKQYPSTKSVEMDQHTQLIYAFLAASLQSTHKSGQLDSKPSKCFPQITISLQNLYKWTSTHNSFSTLLAVCLQSTYKSGQLDIKPSK